MTIANGKLDQRPVLRLGHSPDPDDAFMWWPLFSIDGRPPRIDTGRFRFDRVTADIETLNKTSLTGELEVTAISCAQYPWVQDRYVLTACGCSMGDAYGPKLVSKRPMTLEELRSPAVVVAVPGTRTSAFGALNVMLGKAPESFRFQVVPFEEIVDRVVDGSFAVGLVIHEGQLTFVDQGLTLIEDLGRWWTARFGLPLPLGINVVRRDLEQSYGLCTLKEIAGTLERSVKFAMDHRDEGIAYARDFGRGIGAELTDQFVAMYVNRWTLDFGATGTEAVEVFLKELDQAGLTPRIWSLEIVSALEV